MSESNGVEIIDLPVDAVVYREDLYPRSTTHHEKVQEYAENLDVMPPIEVNQYYILIDGWHRWMAHKKEARQSIKALVTETKSEVALKWLAIRRNNRHGVQISREDKQKAARDTYRDTPLRDRPAMKAEMCEELSITIQTLNKWLLRIDEDTEKEIRHHAVAMWLACHTQEEIAERCGVTQGRVSQWLAKLINFENS